ncbi:hypothetical protein DRZ77_03270 [Candidatus Woesearchaeota archaeon]|nr:MAG: hypothetical protein DRZ77_03270 [Candidatus Woesearchaeota archaeon]
MNKKFWIPWFFLIFPLVTMAQGQEQEKKPLIVVEAIGKVTLKPDIAYVNVGVTREAVEASVAYKEANEIMNRVRSSLLKMGIEKRDIRTVKFSLSPKYEYRSGKQIQVGYIMGHTYRVKVRNIGKVGEVLDAAQKAGATELGQVVFSVDDPTQYQREARTIAMKRAIEKAKTLADAAGISLGPVWRIEEVSYPYPVRPLAGEVRYAKAEVQPPVEAGEMEVSVRVRAEFEIGPAQ